MPTSPTNESNFQTKEPFKTPYMDEEDNPQQTKAVDQLDTEDIRISNVKQQRFNETAIVPPRLQDSYSEDDEDVGIANVLTSRGLVFNAP